MDSSVKLSCSQFINQFSEKFTKFANDHAEYKQRVAKLNKISNIIDLQTASKVLIQNMAKLEIKMGCLKTVKGFYNFDSLGKAIKYTKQTANVLACAAEIFDEAEKIIGEIEIIEESEAFCKAKIRIVQSKGRIEITHIEKVEHPHYDDLEPDDIIKFLEEANLPQATTTQACEPPQTIVCSQATIPPHTTHLSLIPQPASSNAFLGKGQMNTATSRIAPTKGRKISKKKVAKRKLEEEEENETEGYSENEEEEEEEEEEQQQLSIEGSNPRELFKHLSKYSARATEETEKTIEKARKDMERYAMNVLSLLDAHKKLLSSIPFKYDPESKEVELRCVSGCMKCCPPNWKINYPSGRPRKGIKRAKRKSSEEETNEEKFNRLMRQQQLQQEKN